MFWEEAVLKLRSHEPFVPFTVTSLGTGRLVVSGIKAVTYCSSEEVRIRLHGCGLSVRGEGLSVAEIGGGDIWLEGRVREVEFD